MTAEDLETIEFAKRIFPEGCIHYPQDSLPLDATSIVYNAYQQISTSNRRGKQELFGRYEHVCYRCKEKNCNSRQVERGDEKNRWAYLK